MITSVTPYMRECQSCSGTGLVFSTVAFEQPVSDEFIKCTVCDGKGFHLTQSGEELRRVVQAMLDHGLVK